MGPREANQHFSRAVKAVKAGQEVVLTERGKPIAAIKPLRGIDLADAASQRLAGEGRLRYPAPSGGAAGSPFGRRATALAMPADRPAWAYFDTRVLVKCYASADALGLNVVFVR